MSQLPGQPWSSMHMTFHLLLHHAVKTGTGCACRQGLVMHAVTAVYFQARNLQHSVAAVPVVNDWVHGCRKRRELVSGQMRHQSIDHAEAMTGLLCLSPFSYHASLLWPAAEAVRALPPSSSRPRIYIYDLPADLAHPMDQDDGQ